MPIKTSPLSVFVLAFLAPQEAHLEPSVLNAAAGVKKGTWTQLWIFSPLKRPDASFKMPKPIVLLFISQGLGREKKAVRIKRMREFNSRHESMLFSLDFLFLDNANVVWGVYCLSCFYIYNCLSRVLFQAIF